MFVCMQKLPFQNKNVLFLGHMKSDLNFHTLITTIVIVIIVETLYIKISNLGKIPCNISSSCF